MSCIFSTLTGQQSALVSGILYLALAMGFFKLTSITLSFASMIFDLYILPPVNVCIIQGMEMSLFVLSNVALSY